MFDNFHRPGPDTVTPATGKVFCLFRVTGPRRVSRSSGANSPLATVTARAARPGPAAVRWGACTQCQAEDRMARAASAAPGEKNWARCRLLRAVPQTWRVQVTQAGGCLLASKLNSWFGSPTRILKPTRILRLTGRLMFDRDSESSPTGRLGNLVLQRKRVTVPSVPMSHCASDCHGHPGLGHT